MQLPVGDHGHGRDVVHVGPEEGADQGAVGRRAVAPQELPQGHPPEARRFERRPVALLGELGHQRREAPLERLGRPRRVPAAHPGRGKVGAPGAVKEPVARCCHRLGRDPQHARQPGAQLVGPPVEPQPAVLRPAPRRRVPLRRLVLAPPQPPTAAEQHDALARVPLSPVALIVVVSLAPPGSCCQWTRVQRLSMEYEIGFRVPLPP